MSDLYPSRRTPALDPAVFASPPVELRGAPLWSWNCRLDLDELLRQIEVMRKMGLGGFHIHPRTGLDTEYLGEEFMAIVRACAERARELGMRCYLYDEDRWPSGFAGGLVTRDPRHRAKHLLFTPRPYGAGRDAATNVSNSWGNRTENGVLLGTYEVELDEEGCLARYARVAEGAAVLRSDGITDPEHPNTATPQRPNALRWHAYLESPSPVAWYNGQTYVDTLSAEAIRRFVEVTHERYREALGDLFGSVVPSIFTDEPQFTHKRCLADPFEDRDLFLPWTTDLFDTYAEAYGERLEDRLPELFWELPDRAPSLARYRYHDHLAERFAHAFADTVGDWCGAHGLMLTGHMMEEPTLESQTRALGEAMRSYRAFHVPGIDMLCDAMELTTAKQAQSAARQFGRPGVMSELYGVTNWDFDFRGHKRQGDWQAALGVTLRVHHLTWVSMAGEAKRDYPASIGYQSPWWEEYSLVEDHFARVNAVMTRGRPVVRVAVVHPVESFWLAFGPLSQTKDERARREREFKELTEGLLHGLIDFDYLGESLMLSQEVAAEGPRFRVGEMAYEAVIVPGMRTIRATTLDHLEAFRAAGGTLIFTGEVPSLVDAQLSDRAASLAARSVCLPSEIAEVLRTLAPFREVGPFHAPALDAPKLLHGLREEGDTRYLFVCNPDRERPFHDAIRVRGRWRVTTLDTLSGTANTPEAAIVDGTDTAIFGTIPPHGHVLLQLDPGLPAEPNPVREGADKTSFPLSSPQSITLDEPNVLLLDQARYRIDGGEWQGPEEILRIENIVREHAGLGRSDGQIAQPWTDRSPAPVLATLELEFAIETTIRIAEPLLALEDPDDTEILLNGSPPNTQISTPSTHWVDKAIRLVPLPPLDPGRHTLRLTIPFTRRRAVEWCYLLGDFGVDLKDREARLIEPVRYFRWGDWTAQGLPFYAGNVTYRCRIEGMGEFATLRVPDFRAPLLRVSLDGEAKGRIAFAPYALDLGPLDPGEHWLEITAYGSRVNAFGPVHNVDPKLRWYGPGAWRSVGDRWSYEYNLRSCGVLRPPVLDVKLS